MPRAVTRDKVSLFYKDWGEGPPVVLIHGWPLSADSFDDVAVTLAENGFRAIVPDRRGFGRRSAPRRPSPRPTSAPTFEASKACRRS